MKNHYDTLGVPHDATHDEIKSAYRKLCMQTHPDVSSSNSNSSSAFGPTASSLSSSSKEDNAEKFKQISEAYSILGNQKERRRYDFERMESMRFGGLNLKNRGNYNRNAARAGAAGSASAAAALPRNLLIGAMLGVTAVTIGRRMFSSFREKDENDELRVKGTGQRKLVEAWKNPRTGRWETPAPWDPEFQRLRPEVKLVPRGDVFGGDGIRR
ncbi:hypothetical protein ACHAXS_003157 [Conticribra weissflogii]